MNFGKLSLLSVLAVLVVLPNIGCPPPAPAAPTLDNLPDADGDGFLDLSSPEGVETDEEIAIVVRNEISTQDIIALAGDNVPTNLIGLLSISVRQDITRVYDGVGSVTDTDTRALGAFTLSLEAACPDEVTAVVSVIVTAPLVGQVFSQSFPEITVTNGPDPGQFECGEVITVVASLDASGNPVVEIMSVPR